MKKIIAPLKNIQFTEKSVPWILLAACILAFGLMIPNLGYFQDDWNFVFNYYSFGKKGLSEFMQYDGRPYAAWIFNTGFSILGFKPIYWHIAELLIRWMTGYTLWLIFRTLWPNYKWQTISASLLFLLYPFFTLQPLAVTYTLHWTGYLLFSLSLYFMVQAARKKAWHYIVLAIITQIMHLFTIEYYAGIDLIRPIFLWFIFSNEGDISKKEKFNKTISNWLPYLLVFIFYFVWRGFIYQSPDAARGAAAGLSDLLVSPLQTLAYYLTKGIPDVVLVLISSWYKILEPEMFDLSVSSNRFILAIRVLSFAVIYFYLDKFNFSNTSGNKSNTQLKQMVILGIAGLIAGLLPAYGAGYIIHTKLFPWNSRFSLGSLFGAALLITACLEILITSSKIRNVTLALLAGLLIGWHVDYTNDFRWVWAKQVDFYRQLYMRAPDITPNTAILSEEEFLSYMGDYPTAYGINLIYTSQGKNFKESRVADYWFFPLAEFYASFDQYLDGRPFSTTRAGTTFVGEPEGSIVISFEPGLGQCLWVMRPEYASSKSFSQTMKQLASISYVDRIQQAPQNEDSFLLKYLYTKPEQDWCYYYEKADLAYQYEEWDQVIQLWKTAKENDLQPENGFEYLPFIEAYAHTGDWDTAKSMTRTSQKTMQGIDPLLCNIWSKLEGSTSNSTEKDDVLLSVKDDLRCD